MPIEVLPFAPELSVNLHIPLAPFAADTMADIPLSVSVNGKDRDKVTKVELISEIHAKVWQLKRQKPGLYCGPIRIGTPETGQCHTFQVAVTTQPAGKVARKLFGRQSFGHDSLCALQPEYLRWRYYQAPENPVCPQR